MKELFDKLPHKSIEQARQVEYLVDTCFLYHMFVHHEKDFVAFCTNISVGITSFNVEEVLFHARDVNHVIRNRIRSAIHKGLFLQVVDVNVSPGNPEGERKFIANYDKALLNLVPDPSDAVLAAVATSLHAHVLTRDKHHLFTSTLENYFGELGLQVLNNLPE